jgi:20S proteasome subunit beta 7
VAVMMVVVMVVVMGIGMIDAVSVIIHFHFAVVVMIMVVMMMFVLILVIIVVMMVVMMLMLILVVIVVVMVVMMLIFILVVIVVVMMVVLMLILVIIVVMVMVVVFMLIFVIIVVTVSHDFRQDLCLEVGPAFDGLQDHLSVQISQRSGDDGSLFIVLSEKSHRFVYLCIGHLVRTGQDDGAGMLDLVDEELTEVLDIELCLGTVHHGHSTVELHLGILSGAADSGHDFGELAHARRLDQDPFGCVCGHDFTKRGAEVAYQRAADAAAVHLTDLDAGFL